MRRELWGVRLRMPRLTPRCEAWVVRRSLTHATTYTTVWGVRREAWVVRRSLTHATTYTTVWGVRREAFAYARHDLHHGVRCEGVRLRTPQLNHGVRCEGVRLRTPRLTPRCEMWGRSLTHATTYTTVWVVSCEAFAYARHDLHHGVRREGVRLRTPQLTPRCELWVVRRSLTHATTYTTVWDVRAFAYARHNLHHGVSCELWGVRLRTPRLTPRCEAWGRSLTHATTYTTVWVVRREGVRLRTPRLTPRCEAWGRSLTHATTYTTVWGVSCEAFAYARHDLHHGVSCETRCVRREAFANARHDLYHGVRRELWGRSLTHATTPAGGRKPDEELLQCPATGRRQEVLLLLQVSHVQ